MNETRPRRIALYLATGHAYAEQLIEGAVRYRLEHGGVLLRDFRFGDVASRMPRRAPRWSGWGPDGILCNIGAFPQVVKWLKKSGVPIVNTTTDHPHEVLPCVHGVGAGQLAAEYLRSLGLKHFAFVGHEGRLGSKVLRESFRRGLSDCGDDLLWHDLKTAPSAGLESLEETAAAEPGMAAFIREAPKPLGVFALDDDFARVVCRVCRELGLAVPQDVAVLGVEDSIEARVSDPPLSTIRPPGEEVGYAAMELLVSLIAGQKPPPEAIVVPTTKLIERDSTRLRPPADLVMREAMRLIEEEACRAVRVEDVAIVLNISRSTLQHRFVEQFGQTPGEAINAVRLRRAKHLLAETDLTITGIAGMVGFARSSIFGEFFKRHTGQTPSAYRKSQR